MIVSASPRRLAKCILIQETYSYQFVWFSSSCYRSYNHPEPPDDGQSTSIALYQQHHPGQTRASPLSLLRLVLRLRRSSENLWKHSDIWAARCHFPTAGVISIDSRVLEIPTPDTRSRKWMVIGSICRKWLAQVNGEKSLLSLTDWVIHINLPVRQNCKW